MLAFRKVFCGLLLLTMITAAALPARDNTDAPEPGRKAVVTEDDSKWLMNDAEVILKLNMKQMMASDMVKKSGTDGLKQLINSNEQAKAFIEASGLDVTKDFDTVLASAVLTSSNDVKMRVVVRGRFDPEKIQSALKKRDDVKISKAGDTTLFEIPAQDKPLFAAFVDKGTLVLTQDKDATLEAVKNGGKNAAKMSKEMQAALGKFTGKESLAMAMVVNEEIKKSISGIPRFGEAVAKIQTLTAAVTLSDKVDFAVRGITGDAKSAGQLSKLLDVLKATAAAAADDLPPAIQELLNAVKIGSDKESVKIDVQMTKEMIDKASKGG